MECCICRKGLADGIALFRINEKGVPGILACARHIQQTDAAPIDEDVQRLVKVIEGARNA